MNSVVFVAAGVDLGVRGGAPLVHVLEPIRALREAGVKVVLVGLSSESLRLEREDILVTSLCRAWGVRHIVNAVRLARMTRKALRAMPLSGCYVRWGNGAWAAATAARNCRRPLYLEFNGLRRHVEADGVVSRAKKNLHRIIERLYVRDAARIFTTTEAMAVELGREHSIGPDRFVPNHCGVNTQTHYVSMGPWVRTGGAGSLTLGFAGGLWHLTGFDTLMDSMKILASQRPGCRLLVASEGPEVALWEERARTLGLSGAVEFVGGLPYDAVPAFLEDVDIGMAPYNRCPELDQKGGGSPQKVFAYLACGKATVISDLPYYSYLKESGGCAFFKDGDAHSLAEAVFRLAALPPGELAAMGAAGRAYVEKHFTWARNAARIQSVLLDSEDLLRNQGPCA